MHTTKKINLRIHKRCRTFKVVEVHMTVKDQEGEKVRGAIKISKKMKYLSKKTVKFL